MTVGIDFGSSNTLMARWDADSQSACLLSSPERCRNFDYVLPDSDGAVHSVTVHPSIIHYGDQTLVGNRVHEAELVDHPATFRWLKMDMLRANARARRIGNRRVTYREAADELVRQLLADVDAEEELVFAVPVECYDHYVEWLEQCVSSRSVRFVDEATACILGYQQTVAEKAVYLIADFGAGTFDVSLVQTDPDAEGRDKCRIVARAGEEIGGMMIDAWLLEEMGLPKEEINACGGKLLAAVEQAKIALSYEDAAPLSVYSPYSDSLLSHSFQRARLNEILQEQRFFELAGAAIDRALENGLLRYGVRRGDIRRVLVVGGTSLIPAVREQLEHLFPGKLAVSNPFAAVAEGACRFLSGDLVPTIVHDYCVKSWDRENRRDSYTPIVPRGTHYPTSESTKTVYINAAHEDQVRLGLLLYEVSEMARPLTAFVVDSTGRLDLTEDILRRIDSRQPLNPENREFIIAAPPCRRGERRFLASFGVDEEKRLTVSLQDTHDSSNSRIRTPDGKEIPLPVENFPVVRLG